MRGVSGLEGKKQDVSMEASEEKQLLKLIKEGLIAKDSIYVSSGCHETTAAFSLLLCEVPVFWVNL